MKQNKNQQQSYHHEHDNGTVPLIGLDQSEEW